MAMGNLISAYVIVLEIKRDTAISWRERYVNNMYTYNRAPLLDSVFSDYSFHGSSKVMKDCSAIR